MGHRLQPNPVASPALANTDPLPPITVEDLARTDAGEADERRPRPGLDPAVVNVESELNLNCTMYSVVKGSVDAVQLALSRTTVLFDVVYPPLLTFKFCAEPEASVRPVGAATVNGSGRLVVGLV